MAARLYVIPGSHPSMSGRLMLEHKGIPYKRRDLMPVISHAWLKALRFPAATVPSLQIEGRRITGSREISRELDRMQPEPALFPSDPDQREAVEDAERWGDEVLQEFTRRLSWWCLVRRPKALASYAEGAKLGVPLSVAAMSAPAMSRIAARFNHVSDDYIREGMSELPAWLDRIDGWISAGVLGGDDLNAADFQIATSLRLMLTLEDLRPAIEGRPAGALAMRVAPAFPGSLPAVIPAEWLEPLRGNAVESTA